MIIGNIYIRIYCLESINYIVVDIRGYGSNIWLIVEDIWKGVVRWGTLWGRFQSNIYH